MKEDYSLKEEIPVLILLLFLAIIIFCFYITNINSNKKKGQIIQKKITPAEEQIAEEIAQDIWFIYIQNSNSCVGSYPAKSKAPLTMYEVKCEDVKDRIVNKKTYLKLHPSSEK